MGLSADTYACQGDTPAIVLALLETKIETIGTGHDLYYVDVVLQGNLWHGMLIYEP